jgi:hypothetical protein
MVFAFVGACVVGFCGPCSYWNSQPGSEALVLVAIQIISYFCLNPYLIALCDWRNYMTEEAEALMHSSVETNKALKSLLVLALLLLIGLLAFGCLQLCIDTLSGYALWSAMLFDSASLTLPFICLGLYSNLGLQVVQILASLPFLFMIFFSTTFSPGSGVAGVKNLRYLFARFYLWCQVPGYMELMEGCPADDQLTGFSVLTGCLGLIIFLCILAGLHFKVQQRGPRECISLVGLGFGRAACLLTFLMCLFSCFAPIVKF